MTVLYLVAELIARLHDRRLAAGQIQEVTNA